MKPVKRPFKIFFAFIGIGIALVAIGVIGLYYFFPTEKIKSVVEHQAKIALARHVSVGNIRYGIRGIHLYDVIIFDGLSDKDPYLAKIAECQLGIKFSSLISLKINVNLLSLEGFIIDIVYKNGISNVERFIDDFLKTPFTMKINTIQFQDARISLKAPPPILKPLSGTYRASATIDVSQNSTVTITDAEIILPEERGKITADKIEIAKKERGIILKTDLTLHRCQLSWVYGWKSGEPLPFRTFDGKIHDLTITENDIKGKVKGNSLLSTGKTLFADGWCTVTFANKHTLISNTDAKLGNSSAYVKLLSIHSNGNIDKIFLQKFLIDTKDIQPLLPFLPKTVAGNIAGNFSFENKIINAEIKISEGAVGVEGKLVRNVNETIKITNNTFKKDNISAIILDTPFTISIASKGTELKSFIVTASAKEMTIDFHSQEKSELNLIEKNIPITISGTIALDKLFVDKYTFHSAKVTFITSQKQIAINSFTARCFSGDVEGKGLIDFSKGEIDIASSIYFKNIKVQQFLELNEKIKNRVFGTASGKSEISLRATKNEDISKSVKGRLEFTITNGKLVDTGLQNGLGAALSEMKYKLKDLEFSKIHGNLSILGTNYYVNNFEFIAPDVHLKLEGYFTKDLDGDLKLNLEFTKNFIQDVPNPVLLQLNKYKQGGWYIIPFTMKGNITKSENYRRIK
ncbi:MAG: AsmA family protein [Spirochaetes bacterium]|nr:AsmA family protein [Spirochaetota bacterium]